MTDPIPETVVDKTAWVCAKEVDELGEGLTEWEIEFLDSILHQLKRGYELTTAQFVQLGHIHEERVP